MTKQEALIDYKHLCDNCREMFDEPNCDGCASGVAIECIEKQIKCEEYIEQCILRRSDNE